MKKAVYILMLLLYSVYGRSQCNNSCNATNVTIHYYGSQTIHTSQFTYLFNCTNRLKNDCNGATLYTKKYVNNGTYDYRSNNNSWPNQSDAVGITAHWCIEMVYEAFKNLFNYNSYDNAWSQVDVQIYSQDPTMWDDNGDFINIGLFHGTSSYEAVLDIMGHEYAHGILKYSSGLGNGGMDLSSLTALNASAVEATIKEGICDVFGQIVENYVHANYSTTTTDIDDFMMGGNRPGGAQAGHERSMINPLSTGNPEILGGTNWHPDLTLQNTVQDFSELTHQNSTIVGRWYYLLAAGGSGNTNGPWCLSGLGQGAAAQIIFRAATQTIANYNKDFFGLRLATMDAAGQLYGPNSREVAEVAIAWQAVGVGSGYSGAIDVKNQIIGGAAGFNFNSAIQCQNFTVSNGGSVVMTSADVIELLPDVTSVSGSFLGLHIATTGCLGGARPAIGTEEPAASGDPASLGTVEYIADEVLRCSVIPNPSNGHFKIVFDHTVDMPGAVLITDVVGRTVYQEPDPASYSFDVDISELPAGVYIVKAICSDRTFTGKIIKND